VVRGKSQSRVPIRNRRDEPIGHHRVLRGRLRYAGSVSIGIASCEPTHLRVVDPPVTAVNFLSVRGNCDSGRPPVGCRLLEHSLHAAPCTAPEFSSMKTERAALLRPLISGFAARRAARACTAGPGPQGRWHLFRFIYGPYLSAQSPFPVRGLAPSPCFICGHVFRLSPSEPRGPPSFYCKGNSYPMGLHIILKSPNGSFIFPFFSAVARCRTSSQRFPSPFGRSAGAPGGGAPQGPSCATFTSFWCALDYWVFQGAEMLTVFMLAQDKGLHDGERPSTVRQIGAPAKGSGQPPALCGRPARRNPVRLFGTVLHVGPGNSVLPMA